MSYKFKFGSLDVTSTGNVDPNLDIRAARRIWDAIQLRARDKKELGQINVAADGSVTIDDLKK